MSNIAFYKAPDKVSLSGNEMLFKIITNNAWQSTWQNSDGIFEGWLKLAANYNENVIVKFTWGNKEVVFTCKDVPDDSGNQFPSRAIVGSEVEPPESYYQTILEYFSKNVTLIESFSVNLVTNPTRIQFKARNIGTDYNMLLVVAGTYIGELSVIINNVNEALNENYKIGVKIEKNGVFISEHELPPAHLPQTFEMLDTMPAGFNLYSSAMASIDISELTKNDIHGHYRFPRQEAYFGFNHFLITAFRAYVYETWGNPPVKTGGLFSNIINVLQGQLSNFRVGELNYLKKTFNDKLLESGMFLSFAPTTKITDIYAPECLYYPFLTADTFLKLVVKQYYSDGSTATDIKDTTDLPANWIREYWVNYSKIRTNSPRKILKYEVWITDTSNIIISEIRTYVIDYRYQQNARYFLYKNSLGVYDLMRTTGIATKNRSITKEFIRIPLPQNYTETDREEKQINAIAETQYTINFGYFATKEDADYAQEFLMSDDVLWLKRGKAYPVSIKAGKNLVTKDGDFNPEADFDLTHQIHDDFTEQFSANEPILVGDFNIDFNTDYFTGGIAPPPSSLYLFDDEFNNWVAGMPVGWVNKNGTESTFINNNGSMEITTLVGHRANEQFLILQSGLAYNINKNLKIKLIVDVADVTFDNIYVIGINALSTNSQFYALLKKGLNEFIFDFTNYTWMFGDANIIILCSPSSIYPRFICINSIKIEAA